MKSDNFVFDYYCMSLFLLKVKKYFCDRSSNKLKKYLLLGQFLKLNE